MDSSATFSTTDIWITAALALLMPFLDASPLKKVSTKHVGR
jgi:hypothetical protein